MKEKIGIFLALFFISVALIAYELDVMRVFSVTSWSSFGSMVISIALLGYGIAGTLLTFLQKRFRARAGTWLTVTALALGPVMAFSYVLSQYIPFNPVMLVSEQGQIFWIAAYYGLHSLPFFVGAMFIGIAFTVFSDQAHKLYFWNMAGSGVGGFLLLGFMYLMPTASLIIPIVAISSAGAVLTVYAFLKSRFSQNPGPRAKNGFIAGAAVSTLLALLPIFVWGSLQPSGFKGVELAKVTFSDLERRHYEFSPLGEMEVYSSPKLHFAPGLSDNAIFYIDSMPKEAFWALYIDGDGPINIMRKLTEKESAYLDFLPMAAPYELFDDPNVLISHLGGGFGVFTALHHKADHVTIAEPNTALISMMKDTPVIRDFQGDVLNQSKVTLVPREPRAHAVRNGGTYDLVEISLIDSLGLSQSVGNPIHENYTYTTDAIEDYMTTLKDTGILSITTWNHLTPPRNVPKLLTTVIKSLKEQGIEDPGRHLYCFNLIYSTATVLVKKTPFSDSEIEKLNNFCYKMSFEVVYHHGIEPRTDNLEDQLSAYRAKYDRTTENDAEADMVQRPMGDLYYHTIDRLLEGREDELYDQYLFDITPVSDNQPYFTAYFKPETLGMFMNKLDAISEEWGYLLLVGTLIQSVLFGIIIIIIPLIGARKTVFKKSGSTIGVILYYSLLGLAYMLVEIFFIQKLVFYLGNPIFSTSIVIMSMLIISGIGSLVGGRQKKNLRRFIYMAAGIVVAAMLLYIAALPAFLHATLGWPMLVKMFVAVIVIAPSAFFMGMFFPTGLKELSGRRPQLLPWAWGMNGAFSVTGSLLARFIAVQAGFRILLLAALLCYAAAGLLFRVNRKDPAPAIESAGS